MSEPNTDTEIFDVFLCHNSEDKPEIRDIARQLAGNGITPWLDEEQIRPGTSWQVAIGDQIDCIKSAAVFVGESGLGPWQDQEIQALLSQFVKRKCPVIPVVLPSAKKTPKLPWTLQNLHWVDFRVANPDPFKQIIWGITGKKVNDQSKDPPSSDSDISQETDLFPPKEKKVIELRLSGDLDEFSAEEQSKLLQSLNSLLEIGEVKLTRVVAGSIRLYLELNPEDADKIYSADKEGRLSDLGISEARLYPAIAIPPEEEQRSQLLVLLDRVNEYWIDGVLKHSLYNEVLISLGKHALDEAVEPPRKHFLELPNQRRHLILKDRSINRVFDATGLLLILGEPGSGKTTTLLELASDLITRSKSDPKERVPIVLNLSSWRNKQPLAEWIVEELSVKYHVPVKIGRSWLKNDYLLPLLDGLDEVNIALQPACATAINKFIEEFGPSGLVVCCRLMEYQWLPERLKLNGAICLELLGSDEVNEFLTSGGSQLAGLRQAMRVDPVLQELSQTPLMLSIMCLVYEDVNIDNIGKQKAGSNKVRRYLVFNLYIERMFARKEFITTQFPKEKVIGWIAWLAKGMEKHSQSVFMLEGLRPSWLNPVELLAYDALAGLIIAFIFGLGVGLINGLSAGLINGLIAGLIVLIGGLIAGLIAGLIRLVLVLPVGTFGGLSAGMIGPFGQFTEQAGLREQFIEQFVWLVGGLIAGLITGLIAGLIGLIGLIAGLIGGVIVGVIVGVIGGLNHGGSAVVKHYSLRFILWIRGYTPLQFIDFLDHCVKLILLKKVGGGYMFIHRMLLEHFAKM